MLVSSAKLLTNELFKTIILFVSKKGVGSWNGSTCSMASRKEKKIHERASC